MMSDIFNIFSIDWWMDENNNALQMTDSVLFLLLAIPVAYLLLCALFSLGKYRNPYPAQPYSTVSWCFSRCCATGKR